MILLGFLMISENISAQSKKKSKASHKSQITEWKEARNGAAISVKWKLDVGHVSSDGSVSCFIHDNSDHFASEHRVNVYNCNVAVHHDDVIIVTGATFGANDMGEVNLTASSVVNKGIE
jgi:hypothetical protein